MSERTNFSRRPLPSSGPERRTHSQWPPWRGPCATRTHLPRVPPGFRQVDELYEAYCIQRRLQDGASKMKQAFAASPASKAARESLSEVHRSYREYTEVGARCPAACPPVRSARSEDRPAGGLALLVDRQASLFASGFFFFF